MQETYYAATKESKKLVPLEEKSRISRQVELRKVSCLFCSPQVSAGLDDGSQNALDTEQWVEKRLNLLYDGFDRNGF